MSVVKNIIPCESNGFVVMCIVDSLQTFNRIIDTNSHRNVNEITLKSTLFFAPGTKAWQTPLV